MDHSGGIRASSVGINCRYIASACLRARAIEAWSDCGLIGNSRAMLSSVARISEACFMNAIARLRGTVARYDSTKIRMSTSSGLGGGKSLCSVRAGWVTPTIAGPKHDCGVNERGLRNRNRSLSRFVAGAA